MIYIPYTVFSSYYSVDVCCASYGFSILQIAENSAPQSTVGHIKASDADSGKNSRIDFIIRPLSDGASHFLMNPNGGLVQVSPLDREINSDYKFSVEALDGGQVPMSSTVNVTITILDVNDNQPKFEMSEYHLTTDENSPIGSKISQTVAIDMDIGANAALSYKLSSDQPRASKLIEIDPNTGVLTVKGLCSVLCLLIGEQNAYIPKAVNDKALRYI